MSVSMRTASMSVYPQVYRKDDRVFCSTEITEPKSYNVEFSPDGGNNPKQMQAVYEQCADSGQEVEITYTMKNGRFGQSFVVYAVTPVKPVNKPAL